MWCEIYLQTLSSTNEGTKNTWKELICIWKWSHTNQFHQHFMHSFYAGRSQKRKKYSQAINLFWAFGIFAPKGLRKCVDEIDRCAQ